MKAKKLSAAERWTLAILHLYAQEGTREAWPSLSTISDDTGISPRQVRRILARLEGAGFIARKRRPGKTDLFRLSKKVFETANGGPDTMSGVGGTSCPGSPKMGGHNDRTPRTPCPPTPDTMSPEQIQLTDQRTSPGGPGEKKQEPASGSTQEEIEGLWARYTPGEKKIIEKAIAAVASTRRTGRLAPSVVLAILAKLARYPAAVVAGACSVFVERGYAAEGKREGYLLGIARGEARRQEAITRPPAAPAPVEKIPRGYTPEAWAREKALREKMAKWY